MHDAQNAPLRLVGTYQLFLQRPRVSSILVTLLIAACDPCVVTRLRREKSRRQKEKRARRVQACEGYACALRAAQRDWRAKAEVACSAQ